MLAGQPGREPAHLVYHYDSRVWDRPGSEMGVCDDYPIINSPTCEEATVLSVISRVSDDHIERAFPGFQSTSSFRVNVDLAPTPNEPEGCAESGLGPTEAVATRAT